jgi:hypothetical protein
MFVLVFPCKYLSENHFKFLLSRFNHLLLILNSSTNFIIYCFLNTDFKEILRFKFNKTLERVRTVGLLLGAVSGRMVLGIFCARMGYARSSMVL